MQRWPGESDEVFPELFNTAPPFSKNQGKPGQLNDADVEKFYEEGFLVVKDFFKKEELDAVREGVNQLVEQLAQKLYKAGKIKDLYRDHSFFTRLIQLENDFPGANIILHKSGKLPQSFRDLWSNERLLNLVEQFVGPDIAGHPLWNLRTKTPNNDNTTVPWHQDSAYMSPESYGLFLFTAWIPLVDADEVNGCLQMVRNGHKLGKIAKHECCAGPTWYVMLDEEEMEKTLGVNFPQDVVTCDVPYGGMVIFQNVTPHRSLMNLSTHVRWSLDLRWYDPKGPVGMWESKDGVDMRRKDKPALQIDWESFEPVVMLEKLAESVGAHTDDEFDTTLSGPWMNQWQIVNHNRHTQRVVNQSSP